VPRPSLPRTNWNLLGELTLHQKIRPLSGDGTFRTPAEPAIGLRARRAQIAAWIVEQYDPIQAAIGDVRPVSR
jgi:hypothetical protein